MENINELIHDSIGNRDAAQLEQAIGQIDARIKEAQELGNATEEEMTQMQTELENAKEELASIALEQTA
jgi:predicted  nucleic acid-binding Zn-ribbon protein